MPSIKPVTDWKPLRVLPFVEIRTVGMFSDIIPGMLMDMSSIWTEWRFTIKNRSNKNEDVQKDAT